MFMRKNTYKMLYRPFWDIAQENYLYSIDQERTYMLSQENRL